MNESEQRRLRYRLRRGLLEMDLLLSRFAECHLAGLSLPELMALERLLDLPDTQLLQVVLGQVAWEVGADEAALVAKIRGHSVGAGMAQHPVHSPSAKKGWQV